MMDSKEKRRFYTWYEVALETHPEVYDTELDHLWWAYEAGVDKSHRETQSLRDIIIERGETIRELERKYRKLQTQLKDLRGLYEKQMDT